MAENPAFTFGLPRLAAALPDPPAPPDPDAPGPFAFSDADRVRGILAGAGWSDIALDPFDTTIVFGGDGREGVDDAMANLARHPLAKALNEQVAAPVRDRVLEQIRDDFARTARDGRVEFPSAAWIVTARR
jgi:hypothetical protein